MIEITKEYIENNSTHNLSSGCWEWAGYCNPDGYGQRKINGKTLRAHRMSYTVYSGEIPEGLCVLHKCDNPKCCNPEHLFIGTHSDNMKDMWDKNRHPREKNPELSAKLTKDQVMYVRNAEGSISGDALGRILNVSGGTIRNIWNGVTWRNFCEN